MTHRLTTPLQDILADVPTGHEVERTHIESRLRTGDDIAGMIRKLHADASTLMDGDRSFLAVAQWMDRVRAALEALPEYQEILKLRKAKEEGGQRKIA